MHYISFIHRSCIRRVDSSVINELLPMSYFWCLLVILILFFLFFSFIIVSILLCTYCSEVFSFIFVCSTVSLFTTHWLYIGIVLVKWRTGEGKAVLLLHRHPVLKILCFCHIYVIQIHNWSLVCKLVRELAYWIYSQDVRSKPSWVRFILLAVLNCSDSIIVITIIGRTFVPCWFSVSLPWFCMA